MVSLQFEESNIITTNVWTVVMPLCLASLKRPRWDLMGLWLCIELRWGCLLLHCCTGDLWQQSALQRRVYRPGAVHSTLGHYSKLQPWVTLCAPISTSTNDGRRFSRAMQFLLVFMGVSSPHCVTSFKRLLLWCRNRHMNKYCGISSLHLC